MFDVVFYFWVDISSVYFTWRGHYKTIMRGFAVFLIASMSRTNGVKNEKGWGGGGGGGGMHTLHTSNQLPEKQNEFSYKFLSTSILE